MSARGTLRFLIRLALGLLGAYFLLRIVTPIATGFPWADMDWDANGFTTPFELLRSLDIGRGQTVQDGQICREYYSLKDGSVVRVICSA